MKRTSMKSALIIGITGQDGSYLTRFLIKKKYVVHGLIKKNSNFMPNPIIPKKLINKEIFIHKRDILDFIDINELILNIKPCEIYYLATTHELSINQNNFNEVMSINVAGFINILETVKNYIPLSRLFYASSSNVFAGSKKSPQNENTEKIPATLYGVAKLTTMNLIDLYAKQFNIFVCYGILYNHESQLRKKIFLPMKIVDAAVNIKLGLQNTLVLGSLDDQRDWGWAEDYVRAMWMMLQTKKPKNYIIGSGKTITVKDILCYAFEYLNLVWQNYVEIDQSFIRLNYNIKLIADPSKIQRELGWKGSKNFKKVIEQMIDEDMQYKKENTKKFKRNNL